MKEGKVILITVDIMIVLYGNTNSHSLIYCRCCYSSQSFMRWSCLDENDCGILRKCDSILCLVFNHMYCSY